MSAFQRVDGCIGGQGTDENSATQQERLGLEISCIDTAATDYGVGAFVYAKGVASTEVGSIVLINPDDWSTVLADSADGNQGRVGFAMAATVAGEFGWYQICGKAVGKVASGFADNAVCYLTTTAGTIDDAVVAGDRIHDCKGASAIGTPAAGLAELEIDRPSVQNLAD